MSEMSPLCSPLKTIQSWPNPVTGGKNECLLILSSGIELDS